jgi:hypothetical protein
MYSNQSWPPVISPLGVYPCFRNATRAKQGCYRDWQGHTSFVSIWGRYLIFWIEIHCVHIAGQVLSRSKTHSQDLPSFSYSGRCYSSMYVYRLYLLAWKHIFSSSLRSSSPPPQGYRLLWPDSATPAYAFLIEFGSIGLIFVRPYYNIS